MLHSLTSSQSEAKPATKKESLTGIVLLQRERSNWWRRVWSNNSRWRSFSRFRSKSTFNMFSTRSEVRNSKGCCCCCCRSPMIRRSKQPRTTKSAHHKSMLSAMEEMQRSLSLGGETWRGILGGSGFNTLNLFRYSKIIVFFFSI